jgi:hypothetical protein
MTLNGLESTRGALVHDWRLIALDINRGESRAELTGPTFTGKASAPAEKLIP